MKKLLTIAVAAMSAALVQASTVGWGYGGDVVDKGGSDYANGTVWVVYLGDSTDISAISVDGTGALQGATAIVSGSVDDGLVNNGEFLRTSTSDNGNYVMFAAYEGSDGWYYGNTGIQSVTGLKDDPTDSVEVNFGNDAWTLSTPAQAVPEPTSVALLALGLAALGLKRKVA